MTDMSCATTALSTTCIATFINHVQLQIEQDLTTFLHALDFPKNLHDAVLYATLGGGKRVRPILVFASLLSCKQPSTQEVDDARRCALAVELLHCYSLVHDDLPCMDDDELRRGKPTCHIVHGEATALLVGDVLQTLAFEALHTDITGCLAAKQTAKLVQTFAPRARRMVTGQMRDINAENTHTALSQTHLEKIHSDKTGALIEAAVLMGAQCAQADSNQLHQLQKFSEKLGLAFQVQDDILDITTSTEELGKPAGSDEKLNKATYPMLMGLTHAQQYAAQLFLEAKQALGSEFSSDIPLLNVADWLWHRKK